MFGYDHGRVVLTSPVPHIPTAEVLRQDYLGIFEWLDMGYKPSNLYPGKIILIWPLDDPVHAISGGWREVIKTKKAQEIEVHIIPGYQDTWRIEYLHVLAERLRMGLGEAQKEVK